MIRSLLLSTVALLALPASAQEAPAPAPAPGSTVDTAPASEQEMVLDDEAAEEEEAIVITGQRERGAVIGDIPPENQLSARDIRAYGASSVTELLADLAPQTGSARGRGGGQPVVLLNGRRISGFREVRDLPPEAIFRVDILPEEVALKYGYRADQRVVNIVLRPRFRSITARAEGELATEGGRLGSELDVTRLLLQENGRITLNAHVERSGALTEAERDIRLEDEAADERGFRTLIGAREQYRLGGTANRTILGDVSATLDGRLERAEGESLFGADLSGLDPLRRNTTTDTGRLGFALNGNRGRWRWSADGGYEITRTLTRSDRDEEPVEPGDRARTLNRFGELTLVANGPLAELPAGRSNVTVRLSGDTRDLNSETRRGLIQIDRELSRNRAGAAVNVDLPIAKRNGPLAALGNLNLNANAEVERLSDFGKLTTVGGGFVWSPVQRLNLIASVTREEGAPGLTQLGDPVLETPGTRIFDFTSGQTVEILAVTGGNPGLLADKRTVWKLGGTWQPWTETDLDLRFDYTRSRLEDPVSSFPGVTAAIEAAFPDRFTRDAAGQLVRVDLRPLNFDSADRDTFRWGFNYQKQLRSARPTQAQREQLRARAGLPPRAPRPEGAAPAEGAGERRVAGGGFGRFGGGGRQGGRLQLSVFHTLTLKDEVRIGPGLPVLDYLDGEALDSGGGRPRHLVEAEGGYFNNGLGGRLSATWRSGTEVDGNAGDLRFSPITRVNLRLFANLGERFDLVSKHPWLRGSQVRFSVENLFNTRPKVRDTVGATPLNYQSDLLDPLGRTVSISIRKLFLPNRFRQRQGQQRPAG